MKKIVTRHYDENDKVIKEVTEHIREDGSAFVHEQTRKRYELYFREKLEEDETELKPMSRVEKNQKGTSKTLEECLSEITKGTGLKFNVEDGIITGFVFNGDVELNAEEITVSDANFYIGTGGHEMRFTDNSQYKYTDPSTFIGSIKAPTLHADVLLVDNERLIDQINGLKTHIDLLKNEIALLKAEESNYINIWTIVDGEPMLVQKINETDSEEQDNENL